MTSSAEPAGTRRNGPLLCGVGACGATSSRAIKAPTGNRRQSAERSHMQYIGAADAAERLFVRCDGVERPAIRSKKRCFQEGQPVS
jgi:hypothetical protein